MPHASIGKRSDMPTKHANVDIVVTPGTSRGREFAPRIQRTQILKMMEAFKEGRTLNIKYAWPLIKQAKEIFSKESTVQVSTFALYHLLVFQGPTSTA